MTLRLLGALGLIGMLQGCALGHAAIVTVFASPGPKLCEVKLSNNVTPSKDGKIEVTVRGAGIPENAMRLTLLSAEHTYVPFAPSKLSLKEYKDRYGAYKWDEPANVKGYTETKNYRHYTGTWGASYKGEHPCSFKHPLTFEVNIGEKTVATTVPLDSLRGHHDEAYGEFKLNLHSDKLVVGWRENKGKTATTLHSTPKYWVLEPEETVATVSFK